MVDSYVFDTLDFSTKEWHSILCMVKKMPSYSDVVGYNNVVLMEYKELMGDVFVEIPHNKIAIKDYGILQEFLLNIAGTRNSYDEKVKGFLCSNENRDKDFKLYGDEDGKGFYVDILNSSSKVELSEYFSFEEKENTVFHGIGV